ncbi:MAG: DMT family protein, partial [Bacteroidales bacterium]|nr:DMT family protein [Bacteroidales bacterium]
MKGLWTVVLLVFSNSFMTVAWYGHLKYKNVSRYEAWGLTAIVLISWGIALFEYFFQVPANRIGYKGTGGP